VFLVFLLAAATHDVSTWCADRMVGAGDDGRRYAITVLWEAAEQESGNYSCPPMPPCALADLSGDGVVGTPDFKLFVPCFSRTIGDFLPVPEPEPEPEP